MNFDVLLKDLKVSRESCEIILETFILNTDALEFQTLKVIIEEKNKRKLEEVRFLQNACKRNNLKLTGVKGVN